MEKSDKGTEAGCEWWNGETESVNKENERLYQLCLESKDGHSYQEYNSAGMKTGKEWYG